jgi:hypothetical protein
MTTFLTVAHLGMLKRPGQAPARIDDMSEAIAKGQAGGA